ncbi:MAG: arginine--tRNA ligase [Planctomycetota bacterium]
MVKQEIVNALKPALVGIASVDDVEGLIDKPANPAMGDYAVACFRLAKAARKSPNELAVQIANAIKPTGLIEKVQAVGGYVNFFINGPKLAGLLLPGMGADYGKSDVGKGKTIVIDYSSPNIAKPFGIGHLRSTVIGNALYKIYEALGYRCVGINFLGDWGTQFGMMIAAFKQEPRPEMIESLSTAFLSKLYVDYNERCKNDPELLANARKEFKKLEEGDGENKALWELFRRISVQEFNRIYELLGLKFSYPANDMSVLGQLKTHAQIYLGESFYQQFINQSVKEIEAKGLTKISEGALIVDLEKFGMPPCLLRKSDGATLYAARDIAAAVHRYETYKFHKLIYVVGSDQKLHFRQVFKVLELMGYGWAKDCVHVDFGLVRFKGEKMSTRRGTAVLLEEVLDETIELSMKAMQNRKEEIQEKVKPEHTGGIAQSVGIGAVIFNDLKNRRIKDVDFDWDQMLSFEGETGPYLMYTHTRLASVLKKHQDDSHSTNPDGFSEREPGTGRDIHPVRDNRDDVSIDIRAISNGAEPTEEINYALLSQPDEAILVKRLEEFPDIIKKSAGEYEPSILSNYLLEFSSVFNRYYHYHRIISDDKELTSARILLCRRLKQTFRQGLTLLGITPLEEM